MRLHSWQKPVTMMIAIYQQLPLPKVIFCLYGLFCNSGYNKRNIAVVEMIALIMVMVRVPSSWWITWYLI